MQLDWIWPIYLKNSVLFPFREISVMSIEIFCMCTLAKVTSKFVHKIHLPPPPPPQKKGSFLNWHCSKSIGFIKKFFAHPNNQFVCYLLMWKTQFQKIHDKADIFSQLHLGHAQYGVMVFDLYQVLLFNTLWHCPNMVMVNSIYVVRT